MSRGTITRRRFLGLSAAATVGTVLAACAAPAAAPTTTAPSTEPTTAPVPGGTASAGTLRTDWGATTSRLNPWTTGGGIQTTDMIWNRLVELDWKYDQIIPGLAETWETSEDGLTWTFHLRNDVKWHDGEAFTADDVVFTYKTLMHPAVGGWQPAYLTPVVGFAESKAGDTAAELGVKALDDFTVQVTTVKPAPALLGALSALWILPEHHLGEADPTTITEHEYFTTSAVGTGAFKFVEGEFDQFLVLERNLDFFRGAPKIERIISNQIPDISVKMLSMEKGELDVIQLTTPDDIERMKTISTVTVFPHDAPLTQFIQVNVQQPYLSDKRVRQALLHAIDRQTIIETVYKNNAEAVNYGVFKSWIPVDDLNPYEYDPEKAKQLLTDAGFDMSQELRLWFYYTDEFSRKLAAIIQQYWQDLGLTISLNIRAWADALEEYRAGEWDLYYGGSGAVEPDDLRAHFYSKTQYEYPAYIDPELDALFDAGVVEMDPDQRAQIYHDLLWRLNDEAYWLWMWRPFRSWVVNNRVKDMTGKLAGIGFHPPVYHGEDTWYIEE